MKGWIIFIFSTALIAQSKICLSKVTSLSSMTKNPTREISPMVVNSHFPDELTEQMQYLYHLLPLKKKRELIKILNHSLHFKTRDLPNLNELSEFLDHGAGEGKFFSSFIKYQKKIHDYEVKLRAKNLNLGEKKKKLRIFEFISNKCKAVDEPSYYIRSKNALMAYMLPVGLSFPFVSYLNEHGDEEMDATWYMKFFFDLGLIGLQNFTFIKLVGEKQMSLVMGTLVSLLIYNATNLVTTGAYAMIFDEAKEKAREQLEGTTVSEAYQKRADELKGIMQDPELPWRFKRALKNLLGVEQLTEIDSIPDEKLEEVVVELLAAKHYMSKMGDTYTSGYVAVDKFRSDLDVDLQTTIPDVFITGLIYKTLCHGQRTPKKAFLAAISMYAAWTVTFHSYNYWYRDNTTGL